MSLTEQERAKYTQIWGLDAYRQKSPGLRLLGDALPWIDPEYCASFTDWGCGTGKVAHALHDLGHPVRLVDIATNAYQGELPFIEACLWDMPESIDASDHGFCADVLEHIPPEHVQAVLDGLAKRTKVSCFLQIALFHDHFGDQIGQTLHLSVFPPDWWKKRVLQSFGSAEFKLASKGRHLLVLAKP